METGKPQIETILQEEIARTQPRRRLPLLSAVEHKFEQIGEDRYRLSLIELGIILELDRLRRESHELVGELTVRCDLPGARTVSGSLSIADMNLSSARARQDRAKLLTSRANTGDLDWTAIIEELCQGVLAADRNGQPAQDLRTVAETDQNDRLIDMDGFCLPQSHPSILFGDGGTGKSYFSLYFGGRAVERGVTVALFDWELAAEDHKRRLRLLFPDGMPRIMYARCEKPLFFERDRLRRLVEQHHIQYAIYDSIAFACDGPPEAAEVAGRYFRAVREIGCGSLHIAHISKGESADKKPFGSSFWHNGARCTWFAKSPDEGITDQIHLGLFNRKSNLGRIHTALAFKISFQETQTVIQRSDITQSPDLAADLSIRQKMVLYLRKGEMSQDELAEQCETTPDTVRRTAARYKNRFVLLDGGKKIGLLQE